MEEKEIEFEKVYECEIIKSYGKEKIEPYMTYHIIEIPKRNLVKYVRYDNNTHYEIDIDISKLQKSKLKSFQRLTKGAIIIHENI